MHNDRNQTKILIFIVAYNAESTVRNVLSRIPEKLFSDPRLHTEILIIDDSSTDQTFAQSLEHRQSFFACPLTIFKNPKNLGYGGNQKLGYRYALDNKFDVVALLHGDGQYAPEKLPELIEPFLNKDSVPAAVFGSRMLGRFEALKGGMPLYKFIANKFLSAIQNFIVGTTLSEWHSGYRLYDTRMLATIPFERNSNYFDFDTDIIIQISAAGGTITEQKIPTYYGDEICHVDGILYAAKILRSCLIYAAQKYSLFYEAKFDLDQVSNPYQSKFDFDSSHSRALELVNSGDKILVLGCGPAEVAKPFVDKATRSFLVDLSLDKSLTELCPQTLQADLDNIDLDAATQDLTFDKVLILDVIEHLRSPEEFCRKIRAAKSCRNAEIIFSTANIAFLPIRIMLAAGRFNYGKRGILDKTHTRLFTFDSLGRLLTQYGFQITDKQGIPPPLPFAFKSKALSDFLMPIVSYFANLWPAMFAFQIMLKVRVTPSVDDLLNDTKHFSTQISA